MFGKKKEEEKQTAEEIKEEVKPNEGDEKAPEAPTEEKVEEKTEEKKVEEETAAPAETDEDETAETPEPSPEAEEVEPSGNGVRVEDLVTKDELMERLAAMDSKLEALVKENTDLKDALSKMREKYEDKDFGGLQKQGFVEPNKLAEDTFESYSRAFMQK